MLSKKEIRSTVEVLSENRTKIINIKTKLKKGRELIKLLRKYGFKYIGRGCSRRVYISKTENIVVKVDICDDADFQNKNEVETWLNATKKLKKFLVPILAYAEDYSWLIMPYVITLDYDQVNELRFELSRNEIYGSDIDKRNTGIYKGTYRVLDYGIEDW